MAAIEGVSGWNCLKGIHCPHPNRSASLVSGQDGWRCRLAQGTVKCRQTGRWAINAAGWGRHLQSPSSNPYWARG